MAVMAEPADGNENAFKLLTKCSVVFLLLVCFNHGRSGDMQPSALKNIIFHKRFITKNTYRMNCRFELCSCNLHVLIQLMVLSKATNK